MPAKSTHCTYILADLISDSDNDQDDANDTDPTVAAAVVAEAATEATKQRQGDIAPRSR
jgi:hypothetical protein